MARIASVWGMSNRIGELRYTFQSQWENQNPNYTVGCYESVVTRKNCSPVVNP